MHGLHEASGETARQETSASCPLPVISATHNETRDVRCRVVVPWHADCTFSFSLRRCDAIRFKVILKEACSATVVSVVYIGKISIIQQQERQQQRHHDTFLSAS